MFRHAAIVAALLVLCAPAGADQRLKIRGISPVGPGFVQFPNADGTAHLTYETVPDTTEIRLTITGFAPSTIYGVVVLNSGVEVFVSEVAVATNCSGNGTGRISDIPGNLLNDAWVVIFQHDPLEDGNPNGGYSPSVAFSEVRATGYADSALSARANTVKITDFDATGPGTSLNPYADGSAHLTFDTFTQSTEVRVTITGFQPNRVYQIAILNAGVESAVFNQPSEVITTNHCGNGSVRLDVLLQNLIDPFLPQPLSVVIFQSFDYEATACTDGDFSVVSPCEARAVATYTINP